MISKLMIKGFDFQKWDEILKKEVVTIPFKGKLVPCQPFNVKFLVSREFIESDTVEVRALTFTGLIESIVKNFITINIWRIKYLLFKFGFTKDDYYSKPIDVKFSLSNRKKILKKRKNVEKLDKAIYGMKKVIDNLESMVFITEKKQLDKYLVNNMIYTIDCSVTINCPLVLNKPLVVYGTLITNKSFKNTSFVKALKTESYDEFICSKVVKME